MVLPNWDNTPRSGKRGMILKNSSPALFETQLVKAINSLEKTREEERFLFIKSWNEWAEGNYMEPDAKHGHSYLESFRKIMNIPSLSDQDDIDKQPNRFKLKAGKV